MPAAISFLHIRRAAQAIFDGGIIAYPTEGVFGLGCDPDRHDAVLRILELKERNPAAGLILIAADRAQLEGWVAPSRGEEQRLAAGDSFVTWVVTAAPDCPDWISGGRRTCAVRITQHPVAAALCRDAGMPLVSTSANRHGRQPARSALSVRRQFGARIDCIVPGATGGAAGPSEIRVAATGALLRAG